jgi:hypothetical protein
MHNTFHSRQDFINSIIHFQIPKIEIARMTGLDASRISEYIRKKPLPANTVEKIEATVEQIVKVWSVLPVKVDLSDREGFARAVQIADDAIAKTEHAEVTDATEGFVKEIESGFAEIFGSAPQLELCTESGQGEK